MAFKISFEFLFVGKGEEGFVKNYFYELEDPKKREKTGQIFINLEVVNNPALGEEIGGVVFETAKQAFYANLEEVSYKRFEETLKAVNEIVHKMQQEKEFKFVPNVNVIIGAIVNGELFLSQAGDAEAYLVRRRHVSVISEGLSEDKGEDELFANIASGVLEVGDTIVFSSTRLLRFLTKNDLGRIFSAPQMREALETLKGQVNSEIANKASFLGLRVEPGYAVDSELIEEKKVIPKWTEFKWFREHWTKIQTVLSRSKRPAEKLKRWTWPRFHKEHILALLVILAVVLVAGVYSLKKRHDDNQRILGLEGKLSEVQEQINLAGTKGTYDKKQAGLILVKAEETALEVLNSGLMGAEARQRLEDIRTQRDQLDNIQRMETPEVLVDLTEKRANVVSLGLIPFDNHFYVFEYNALYEVMLDRVADPLTIDETEVVVSGAYFEDREALVFFTKQHNVIEYKDGRFAFMDTDDPVWHGGTAIEAYGKRIYLLSPEDNQIWRYERKRDKYTGGSGYNQTGDVSEGVDLAIDSSIYILKKTGEIERHYGGEKQELAIAKAPLEPMRMPVKLYTENGFDFLYVLDQAGKVLVFRKELDTGNLIYSHQYLFEDLTGLVDLYVDKDTNRLYLLDQSKVYQLSL